MKKRTLKGRECKKVAERLVKAIREGHVEIGNDAYNKRVPQHVTIFKYKAGISAPDMFGKKHRYPAAEGFVIAWHNERGFGEVTICVENGKFKVSDSEYESREFVRGLLCALIDEAEWDFDEKTGKRWPPKRPYSKEKK